jgi:hypothetical protein
MPLLLFPPMIQFPIQEVEEMGAMGETEEMIFLVEGMTLETISVISRLETYIAAERFS